MIRRTALALIIATAPAFGAGHSTDIVDIAASNESFSTLVTAVSEAGLVDTLKGDGPFTVFAPTNDAFAALPAGTVETLLQDENLADLQAVLGYHVVAGTIMAADIPAGRTELTTINGAILIVTNEGGGVKVGNSNVVSTDIEASNGVIHVLDAVLLP